MRWNPEKSDLGDPDFIKRKQTSRPLPLLCQHFSPRQIYIMVKCYKSAHQIFVSGRAELLLVQFHLLQVLSASV